LVKLVYANFMDRMERSNVKKLRQLLASDGFASENRLPPERVLAAQWKISRASLRKALAVLEDEGKIWRHVGQGTFVGPPPEAGQEGLSRVTAVTNPAEIMEARLVLEPQLASLAAWRATMSELAQMETHLVRYRKATSTADVERWDRLLHLTIARAGDNSLLLSFYRVIYEVLQSNIWGSLKEASLTPERRKIYFQQHTDLVKALKDRDAAQAESMMREHLETIKKHLLEIPRRAHD
jgi:DNA-binding FadR family transcriptional regulator